VSEARRFPPETSSVRDVRHYVGQALDGVAQDQVEIILLATSELAANSVRHAGTSYTVQVDRTEAEIRVTVEDDGDGEPEVQDPGPLTPSGRGLLIVEQLSDAWGASRTTGQNRVWFSMHLRPADAPTSGYRHASGPRTSERAWRPRRRPTWSLPCRRRGSGPGVGRPPAMATRWPRATAR
jgi:anti-sigma regulatory factor (Ser/Thr protein kinase)